MRKLIGVLLGCLMSLTAPASSNHAYFNVNNNGILDNTQYKSTDNWSISVEHIIYSSNKYVSIAMVFEGPEAEYEVYRLHANGKHYASDETDPLWNMELQPTINPKWCSYSYGVIDGIATLKFTDTFDVNILVHENPQANAIRYRIYDRTHNNDYTIQFNNAIHEDIITSVNPVKSDINNPVYYNLQGIRSNVPFKGINIMVVNSKAKKVIY